MIGNTLLGRGIALIIMVLFIGASIVPGISGNNVFGELDVGTSRTSFNEGSLSGYVNDTNMDPIEGALVRVYFHGTYEEDYSDSSGYYHVTDIPICNCTKNCTASKEEYITEWVWLSIGENTTYDFVLTPLAQYNGSLSGYVNDTSMNPIEGALVQVYFHGTYEENYSDTSGYYHVTNIPICYCLKNCTASKQGYKTEWVLLGITENTTYDFVLEPLTGPELAIGITDGFIVIIRNIGGANATDVNWGIAIDGGFFFFTPREDSGTIETLGSGKSVEIAMPTRGIGLGRLTDIPTITATAECAEGSSAEASLEFRILFSFIIIRYNQ